MSLYVTYVCDVTYEVPHPVLFLLDHLQQASLSFQNCQLSHCWFPADLPCLSNLMKSSRFPEINGLYLIHMSGGFSSRLRFFPVGTTLETRYEVFVG